MTEFADRNLLFGILALQMDFISRDALITAMNRWVLEKNTPLGLLLLQQKALTPDTHALLEALVQKRLEQGSPAVASSAGLAGAPREEIANPDPHAATMSVGTLISTGQRFRVLRPHAKGGLGEVFVAYDEELNREVALKEIQGHHAQDKASRLRFVLEAEITGGLEHPGIVPVYGIGKHDDGRPYYAMRFIRGRTLSHAVKDLHQKRAAAKDTSLDLSVLLHAFVVVCNTIGYAHSRGVIHRDLKGSNVILGNFGEVVVLDWGLAKVVGTPDSMDGVNRGSLLERMGDSGATARHAGVHGPRTGRGTNRSDRSLHGAYRWISRTITSGVSSRTPATASRRFGQSTSGSDWIYGKPKRSCLRPRALQRRSPSMRSGSPPSWSKSCRWPRSVTTS